MLQNKEKSLLIGRKDIMNRYGLSKEVFYMFVRLGMPIRKINNRLYGHTDHLDNFFKKVTIPGKPIEIDEEIIPDLEENDD